MNSRPNKPSYNFAPVNDVKTLALALGLTERQLNRLAANAGNMYRRNVVAKKDGTERITWDAHRQLKAVQGRINQLFFHKVLFPLYLQGSIRDRAYPRDYVRNAEIHAGACVAVTLDIADFFPSTQAELVRDIWTNFFRFAPPVAVVLTQLTTKDGFLPQGARTSSYLANLVFWQREHSLVETLEKRGWRYSRLVDDITISKSTDTSQTELTDINRIAIGCFQGYGYSVKRSKHKVLRRNHRVTVNSLVVNVHPALPKDERRRIRAQVHQVKEALTSGTQADVPSVASTRGKIAKVIRLHPDLGSRLSDRLGQAVPFDTEGSPE
ncbi:reverse transcriptase family protein [Paraburkholderia bryophila]|uniref:Reverse transcriptase (RNA-dependent DNA polymerase) n=1 Tax=Paraburkholderia bryophila TaxID=420952 RepID=A0A329CXG0_9BURK|nr:reverse transcriptase family protein [Paraburkholderia bryophila]RAS38341.1 reverse transcriptase (RNA-dependent DNA polymerase) [Paraburkholderia bryophila]